MSWTGIQFFKILICKRQCQANEKTIHRPKENLCKAYLINDCIPRYTKTPALLTFWFLALWFQTSGLQKCKIIDLCCFKPLSFFFFFFLPSFLFFFLFPQLFLWWSFIFWKFWKILPLEETWVKDTKISHVSLQLSQNKVSFMRKFESSVVAQRKRIQLVSMRMWVRSLASGSVIWCLCELWCSLQMLLGSHIVVAVV